MSSVSVGISIAAANGVVAGAGTASKLVVGLQDTSINDVGIGSLAGSVIVDVGGGTGARVGNSSQAPGGAGLGDQGTALDLDGVLLGDLRDIPDLVLLDLENLLLIVRNASPL